jgi:hypothetical protein
MDEDREIFPSTAPVDVALPPLEVGRREVLDIATTLMLVRGNGTESVRTAVNALAMSYEGQVEANGRARRARLAATVASTSDEIVRRGDLVKTMEADYASRARLRIARGDLEADLGARQAELLARRQKAEDERLDQEILRLRNDETTVVPESPLAQPPPATSADPSPVDERLEALETRRNEIKAAEQPIFDREEALRARGITRTVARVWPESDSGAAPSSARRLLACHPRPLP